MSITLISPAQKQADDALCLLADLYARRFQAEVPSASDRIRLACWHAYELIRETLRQAHHQADALAQLENLAQQVEEEHRDQEAEATAWQQAVLDASALVAQVIDAGGSARTLLAGETDGYRHLCLHCCQDKTHFEQIRFFNHAARRPLLIPEICSMGHRSMYDRCQICLQALAPVKYVVLVPTGTVKHEKGCACHSIGK